MAQAPAFQLYANDWLSSTKIALMTPAQEGAYIRLLCYAWNDPNCSIPDDDQELSVLSRLGEGWFNGGSAMVRKCFEPHPALPGRLVNRRLIEEREKQLAWREKSKQGGLKSGVSRRKQQPESTKGGSTVVEPKGNSSSSSSSSSSKKKEGKAALNGHGGPSLTGSELNQLALVTNTTLATLGSGRLFKFEREAWEMKVNGVDFDRLPAFAVWYRENDWRGKKGEAPTVPMICKLWGTFSASGSGNGSAPENCRDCHGTKETLTFDDNDQPNGRTACKTCAE